MATNKDQPVVGLLHCLVDAMRPSVGMAAVKLLEAAGCKVVVPENQTCCGQPAWNSGDVNAARAAARPFLDAFDDCDHIVVPSGSCGGMLAHHLTELFADSDDSHASKKAAEIAAKTSELTAFLYDVMGISTLPGRFAGRIAYHDSCSSLREMQVKDQPRALLRQIGADVVDLDKADTCCGFGGTFAVKFGNIQAPWSMIRLRILPRNRLDLVLAGDLGCLMNIAGRLSRRGSDLEVRHVAEVLAGEMQAQPIGAGSKGLRGRHGSFIRKIQTECRCCR